MSQHEAHRQQFLEEVQRWLTDAAADAPTMSQDNAQRYCRDLARGHYENFTVASFFVPRQLRQPFYNIYAYCRWSDDLADEIDAADESLAMLDRWEAELDRCYEGEVRHPVFVALKDTIAEYDIPREPFADLLVAFRMDQRRPVYETFDQLLEYCKYSANPVGRLVLRLGRCDSDEAVELSDAICTGLQLANHLQDVARDYKRGRIYLPGEEMRRGGISVETLEQPSGDDSFRQLMREQVDRAETFFDRGEPLVGLVSRQLRVQIDLFVRAGRAVLDSIRRIDYDVLAKRPTISKWRKLRLLGSAVWGLMRRGG